MKKQNGNQTSVLSKPTTSRTVRSPRARGKRAPSKMDESVKVKENIPDENKECKDDVDKESVPLSEKEKMEEMIRRDSTLSNGDLDTVSIPNAVHGVKDPQVENTVKHSDELEDNKTDNENLNDESTDKIETDNTAVADKTERNDVENRSYIENLNRYQERRTTGSAVSLNSKEGKGEVTKSSTSSLNLVEKKEDSIENSTGSLNSKESKKTPSKSSNGQFNNSKRQSIKASTVSINSKESRPSSLKTSYKSEAISLTSFETGGTKQTTPKKEVPVTKDEKPKSEVETTVIVTETNCNGTNHVVHNDLTKTITGKTDKISLTVPGFIVEGENTQITKGEARKDSVISDVTRRESTKYSLGSRKSMDMRVQYTTVQMPTTEDKTKPSVYATDDSWIRIAIPYLPVGLAVFCLLMNICVPGLGTMISGFSIFCCAKSRVPPKYDQDILLILCVNIWVGVAQLFTVSFLLVGWFWSLAWGIKMVILAVERRQELRDKRAKELQTLALKAFGSSIPAAHMTPMPVDGSRIA